MVQLEPPPVKLSRPIQVYPAYACIRGDAFLHLDDTDSSFLLFGAGLARLLQDLFTWFHDGTSFRERDKETAINALPVSGPLGPMDDSPPELGAHIAQTAVE